MLILNSINDSIMQELHKGNDFPLPDITDKRYIGHKTIVDNGQVQAIGLVKLTTEGILIVNKNIPDISKSKAIDKLISAFKTDITVKQIHECHVFVKDERFKNFLQKIGFSPCKGGEPLIIHF